MKTVRAFGFALSAIATVGIGLVVIGQTTPATAAPPYTTTSEYTAFDFATNFPSSNVNQDPSYAPYDVLGVPTGPVGLAFDPGGYLLVTDIVTGGLYKFAQPGGVASSATKVGQLDPGATGLAFSPDRRLYVANQKEGIVQEIDPITYTVLRTVAHVNCATGVAFDPISGDLFVTEGVCSGPIVRVENPGAVTPTVVNYTVGTVTTDGVGFDPGGTLYVVDGPRGSQTVLQDYEGTAAASPGALVGTLATVPYGDGMTFSKPVGTFEPRYIYVNRNDGRVTRVDLTGASAPLDVLTGGSRGDFMTTGPDGCLYPTQSGTVAKITFTDGFCDGLPTLVPAASTAPPGSVHAGAGGSVNRTGSAVGGSSPANSTGAAAAGQLLANTGFNALWGLLGALLMALLVVTRRLAMLRRHQPSL